jgi:hypothetical protein
MSLSNNVAILLLGAPNRKGLAVAPALADKGVDLLRKAPSEVNIVAIPDMIQPRFALYRGTLPHHMLSYYKGGTKVSLATQGALCEYQGDTLPLPLPNLIMSWTVAVPEEVVDEIKAKWNGMPSVAKGKASLEVKITRISDLPLLVQYKPNPVAPCVENAINVAAFRQLVGVIRIFSLFLKLHQYPAFADLEHLSNFSNHYTDGGEDVADLDSKETKQLMNTHLNYNSCRPSSRIRRKSLYYSPGRETLHL